MTDQAPSIDELLTICAEAFQTPVENLSPTLSREQIKGWDSMGTLMLMAELDERFGLMLSAEQLSTIKSIDDIFTLLKAKHT